MSAIVILAVRVCATAALGWLLHDPISDAVYGWREGLWRGALLIIVETAIAAVFVLDGIWL